ncbi:hypothetical protein ACIBO2_18850 [Nonomuraea sp. NPDC050022]|uniref:hypothetical protein n=1 Tax=Nonomuraea sp. NPDC050022 TaxID=3364358 RepID=UPI003799B54A
MNPSAAELAADVIQWVAERMLVQLRDELTAFGVNAELRDNNSALMVARLRPGLPVRVIVEYDGLYYSWHDAKKRHPTNDPRGAASILAEYVKGR